MLSSVIVVAGGSSWITKTKTKPIIFISEIFLSFESLQREMDKIYSGTKINLYVSMEMSGNAYLHSIVIDRNGIRKYLDSFVSVSSFVYNARE